MIDTTKYTQVLILKRHWPLAVTTALTVIAVIVPVAIGLPNVYRTGTKLSIERQVGMTTTQSQIVNGLETRFLMIKNETLSRPYLIDLIDRLNLYPELRRKTSLDTVVNRVQRDISVNQNSVTTGREGPATLTFTLAYMGDDPAKVAEVANALGHFYIDQNDVLRNRQAAKMAEALESQVKEAKRQSDEANTKYQTYLTMHASKLPEAIGNKTMAWTRISNDLLTKTNQLSNLKTTKNNLDLLIAAEASKPVAASVITTPEQQLANARMELKKLLDNKAGDSNAAVVSWRREIDRLDALTRTPNSGATAGAATVTSQLQVYQRNLKATEDDIKTLNVEISKLEETGRALQAEINSIPTRSPEVDDLKKDADSKREQYDSFRRNYDQVAFAAQSVQGQGSEEFRILEEAGVPLEPAGPNRLNLIVGGIIGAIVLGIGLAVVRDQFDTSFHTIDELRGFTQVPILASIPKIATNKHRARRAAILVVGASVLLVSLAVVGMGAYEYAKRHAGITRLITK